MYDIDSSQYYALMKLKYYNLYHTYRYNNIINISLFHNKGKIWLFMLI